MRAEIDLDEAIAILMEVSASASFAPWGSHALSRLLLRAERKDEARSHRTKLFDTHPEFAAGWQSRLDCCLSHVEYQDVASQILDQLKINVPQILWLRSLLIEVLFAVGQGDIKHVLKNATNAGIIEENAADRVIDLLPILSKIRSTDKGVVEGATAWRYSFCGADHPVMVRSDDLVQINLSHMALDGIDDGEKELAPLFHRVCTRLLNELPYDDDHGLNSLSKVTSQDLGSVYFSLLLKALARRNDEYRVTSPPKMKIERGQLWVRMGNVEAWALSSYLIDRQACLTAAGNAAQILDITANDFDEVGSKSQWWPRTNAVENILRLNSNAGWYADPGSGRAEFGDWAERYLGALRAGNIISCHSNDDLLKLAAMSPELGELQPAAWTEQAFFQAIDGRSVLLVSPFAAQISSQFKTGAVNRIWAAQGITARLQSLETIEPPMSVWPYRPDKDWSESFLRLEEQCLARLEKSGADFFIASCGCYGLPLVHSINQSSAVTSVYNGHVINMFFGIVTQAFLNYSFFANAPSELFVDGDLEKRYEFIGRIDAGRYGSPQTVPCEDL